MPIHARYRWFYPIDWPQLSAVIRFRRAQGKCEGCGRPHGTTVCHLGDVGSREEAVARRTRQTDPAATRAVAVEGDDPVDARGWPARISITTQPITSPQT